MMRAVADATRPHEIPTIVSLNPIMVDGTGMCGGCRVLVGGTSKFACVDGPEFDAHDVDFTVLAQRNSLYRSQETKALQAFEAQPDRDLRDVHHCHLEQLHPEDRPFRRLILQGTDAMAEKLPPKERTKIARQAMPEQDAHQRAGNFTEVNLGFDAAIAEKEAQRCLTCADPKCVHGCPVGVKIREVVDLVREGEYLKAAAKLREDNVLPAVTGRVCPQETQCEGACILGKRFSSLAIGHIERFVADYERQTGQLGLPPRAPNTGKRIAIVGSGPAGLSCAGDLVQRGHCVTVFEALHEIGGVLVYGIPEFRLPKHIVQGEVDNLRRMGVEFQTNVVVGQTVTVDELFHEETV